MGEGETFAYFKALLRHPSEETAKMPVLGGIKLGTGTAPIRIRSRNGHSTAFGRKQNEIMQTETVTYHDMAALLSIHNRMSHTGTCDL
jgi:hypothetical protein